LVVTKEQTIAEVLRLNPKTAEVFTRYGMHCFGCHIAFSETVGEAARAHGVDADLLVADLNELLANEKEEDKEH